MFALASCGDHTHAFDEGEVTTEATCFREGVKTRTCECGEKKLEPIDKLAHDYSTSWSYDNEYHYHECETENCIGVSDKTLHTWVVDKVKAATCVATGETVYKCACGATKTEPIAKIAHSFTKEEITKAPTCIAKGEKTVSCACGLKRTEALDVIAHSFVDEWSFNETHHYRTCATEGCTEIVDLIPHAFDEGKVSIPATCNTKGEKIYTCACGATKTEEISTSAHDFGTEWISDNDYHYHACQRDNCFGIDEKIPHVWGEGVLTQAPTKKVPGVMTYTCYCGKTKTETVPYVEHIYSTEWVKEDGRHYRVCTEKNHTDIIDEGEHDWVFSYVIEYPTPDTCGKSAYFCSVCGHTATRFTLYEDSLPSNMVGADGWEMLVTEEKMSDVMFTGSLTGVNGTYGLIGVIYENESYRYLVDSKGVASEEIFVVHEDGIISRYFVKNDVLEIEDNYNFAYTAKMFANFLSLEGTYFDFVYSVEKGAYVATDVTLGERVCKSVEIYVSDGNVARAVVELAEAHSFREGVSFTGFDIMFSYDGEGFVMPIA